MMVATVELFVESMLEMKAENLADQKAAMMVVEIVESRVFSM
jgi:hypothetical protein